MREILAEVQSGEFAREWILENKAGQPVMNALRRQHSEHQIEQVGDALGDIVTAEVVGSWLDREPWTYLQTELFWHTLTVAVWCETCLSCRDRIGPAVDEAG